MNIILQWSVADT